MLGLISLLLILLAGILKRWRNTAAAEDVSTLMAITSPEIENRQPADDSSIDKSPQQLQQRHCCALCYNPSTTRCSQCKAVRYCSGKCQIIHWRKAHKFDCQPAILIAANKCVVEEAAFSDEGGSSFKNPTDSLPFFPSSAEESETSVDTQTAEEIMKPSYSGSSNIAASSAKHWKNKGPVRSSSNRRNDPMNGRNSVIKESCVFYGQQAAILPRLFQQLYSCNTIKFRPFGLTNCGNSCYANAVLQCLAFTRPLTSYFLQGLHSKTCRKRDWCLVCEFEYLIRKGREANYPLSPVGIISQVKRIGSHLNPGRQEDAHDFLRNVVEKMQSVWLEETGFLGYFAEDSTLLGLSFGGYVQSKIKCLKCSGRSERCDRVMDISVEINGNIDSLEAALEQFTVSETLGGDDKYKCSRCKSYENAKKKLTVVEAPNILTVILKRFQSGNMEKKLNKVVRFPESLDLTPYTSRSSDKNPIYGLYAVVVHSDAANSSYSGHYISFVKDANGDWFRIDDSRVGRVEVEAVLSSEAYMLFYARRRVRIPSFLVNGGGACSDYKRSSDGVSGRNLDSSSDNSSVFSASDAGSYGTDSTKNSSSEDFSLYSRR